MVQINRKTARLKLTARKAPYYAEIRDGLHVGYRRMKTDKAGRWLVRERQPDARYKEQAIGTADDLIAANGDTILTYDQAVQRASGAAARIHTGMPTVHEAARDWLDFKLGTATNKRSITQAKWQARALCDQWPDVPLDRVRAADIDRWHKSLVTATDEHEARSQRATADRKLAHLVAVLNRAHDLHELAIPRPWSKVKRFGKQAGNPRINRLTSIQIRTLISLADADLASYIALIAETGLRPSEAYAATCRDWDGEWLTVSGKTGRRTIRVSAAARALLDALTAGINAPDRHILLRFNGLPWRGNTGDLTKAFTKARNRACLNPDVVAYTLRHSFISDALERGAPSVLVAKHCGTSVQQLEKTYAKFLPETADNFMGGLTENNS